MHLSWLHVPEQQSWLLKQVPPAMVHPHWKRPLQTPVQQSAALKHV
jgi:hypothetical protein